MNTHANKPTVLCIDDDKNVLSALQRELTRFGCAVRTSLDPTSVKRILTEHDIDILITDAVMPKMSGIQVLEQAIDASPGTARIMLTGHCGRADIVIPAVNRGEIYRLVPKPWEYGELQAAVAESMCLTVAEWESRYVMSKYTVTATAANSSRAA